MDIHAGVMQHQVLEADEVAGEPQAGAGVLEMGPADKTLGDRARPDALIEAGERILGGGERAQSGTRQRPIRGCAREGWRGSREQRGDIDRDAWDEVRREGSAGPALLRSIGALLRPAVDFDGGGRKIDDPDLGTPKLRVERQLGPAVIGERAVGHFNEEKNVGGAGVICLIVVGAGRSSIRSGSGSL